MTQTKPPHGITPQQATDLRALASTLAASRAAQFRKEGWPDYALALEQLHHFSGETYQRKRHELRLMGIKYQLVQEAAAGKSVPSSADVAAALENLPALSPVTGENLGQKAAQCGVLGAKVIKGMAREREEVECGVHAARAEGDVEGVERLDGELDGRLDDTSALSGLQSLLSPFDSRCCQLSANIEALGLPTKRVESVSELEPGPSIPSASVKGEKQHREDKKDKKDKKEKRGLRVAIRHFVNKIV